jgi:hypothetical protein
MQRSKKKVMVNITLLKCLHIEHTQFDYSRGSSTFLEIFNCDLVKSLKNSCLSLLTCVFCATISFLFSRKVLFTNIVVHLSLELCCPLLIGTSPCGY